MRHPSRLTGFAAGIAMVMLIAAIALGGKWPGTQSVGRPEKHGILALPADRVARIEVAAGERDMVFAHRASGDWAVDGAEAEKALCEHIDDAVRMLNLSNPTRVLEPGEYGAADVSQFGLDPPRLLVSLVATGGATRTITFGEATPGDNAQYVRVIGRPELYLLARFVGVEWELAMDMAERLAPAQTAAQRPSALLLPVSLAEIWAVEIVENGALTRFERDPAGDWFHHVGQHVHLPGGFVHKADPRTAPLIGAELAALERASVEAVVARHPSDDALGEVGLLHPSAIMLLYTRDSSRPVARVEFGNATPDGLGRYARVQETDSVVTVPLYATTHVDKLLQLAGVRS